MKFNGENIEAVMEAHARWLETGEEEADRADFSGADLRGAFMARCNLYGAIFRGANLRGACLFQSNLQMADLTGANLFGADLFGADLRGAINPPFIPLLCPDTGSFIGWKRAKAAPGKHVYENSVIVKLLIPEDAERTSTLDGECRASKAKVLEVQTLAGDVIRNGVGVSIRDNKTLYIPGQTVESNGLWQERHVHHTHGIFFFINRQQAVEYLTWGTTNGVTEPIDMEDAKSWLEDAAAPRNHNGDEKQCLKSNP